MSRLLNAGTTLDVPTIARRASGGPDRKPLENGLQLADQDPDVGLVCFEAEDVHLRDRVRRKLDSHFKVFEGPGFDGDFQLWLHGLQHGAAMSVRMQCAALIKPTNKLRRLKKRAGGSHGGSFRAAQGRAVKPIGVPVLGSRGELPGMNPQTEASNLDVRVFAWGHDRLGQSALTRRVRVNDSARTTCRQRPA